MEGTYCVYKHVNKLNGKMYVGITRLRPEERWGKAGSGYDNTYFKLAINKYGWDNFEHVILERGLTKEEACLREQEYIKEFRSNERDFGYNMTSGGESTQFNEIVREKIRIAKTGSTITEETRAKLRSSHMGNKLTPETIAKMLETRKGFHHSEETKRKISEKRKGIVFSDEHIKHLSEAQKGKTYSEEYKENMRKNSPSAIKVICIENGVTYDSYYHAAKELFGYEKSSEYISLCARGKKESYRGYHFKIKEA